MAHSSVILLKIGPRGQITIPNRIRNKWKSKVVSLEFTEDENKVTLFPLKNAESSLAKFKKDSSLSFEEIREQSWRDSFKSQQEK